MLTGKGEKAMKRLLILALVVIFYSVPSFAQGGLIGIYLDTWGELCDIDDCEEGKITVLEVQVVHKLAPCATGSQFMIITSEGFTGTYLGEELPDPIGGCMGNSQTGVAIGYSAHLICPIHIMTVRYLIYGTSEPNSYIEVVADASSPFHYETPMMTDCSDIHQIHPAIGGRAYINGDGTFSCTTTPVEIKTWGQIKALYRN
jgi:hypothetical protein